MPNVKELIKGVLAGNRRRLAQAITLIESYADADKANVESLTDALAQKSGNAIRVGVAGTPGVGKSSLIEVLGLHLISRGMKVAVLAVDPTSFKSSGSILGDKTRMPKLSADESAFVRPSPSQKMLGGVAPKTYEVMLACEAAGYNVILIETVGIGQSEVDVAELVDVFLLLIQPGSGDELQGIKKGILELADIIVITKMDGELRDIATETKRQVIRALGNKRLLTAVSAHENAGIPDLWSFIDKYWKESVKVSEHRSRQARYWILKTAIYELQKKLSEQYENSSELTSLVEKVVAKEISITRAASILRLV